MVPLFLQLQIVLTTNKRLVLPRVLGRVCETPLLGETYRGPIYLLRSWTSLLPFDLFFETPTKKPKEYFQKNRRRGRRRKWERKGE